MKNFEKYKNLMQSCDAFLLTGRPNRMYCAQFDVAEGIAFLTAGEAFYFTDSRYIESAQKNLPDFTVLEVNREHGYLSRLNDAICARSVKTVGFEEREMTHGAFLRYEKELKAALSPMQEQLDALRQSKEPWEIERMKTAQKITDRTFSDLLDVIRAGMTEKELEAELIYRLYQNGAERPAFDPVVVSGPNTSMPHGVAGSRTLQYGDFVTLDFGALYGGYCADMTRTVALGFVSEQMHEVYQTVLQAQLAGLSATKAGKTGKEIDAAARNVICEAGYGEYFGHAYGHSLGIEIHENPNASPSNEEKMPVGAVVSAEPGIYLPEKFGVRIEDVVIFTPDGCENITKSAKNLIIL